MDDNGSASIHPQCFCNDATDTCKLTGTVTSDGITVHASYCVNPLLATVMLAAINGNAGSSGWKKAYDATGISNCQGPDMSAICSFGGTFDGTKSLPDSGQSCPWSH